MTKHDEPLIKETEVDFEELRSRDKEKQPDDQIAGDEEIEDALRHLEEMEDMRLQGERRADQGLDDEERSINNRLFKT
jgi:hypothetical protein